MNTKAEASAIERALRDKRNHVRAEFEKNYHKTDLDLFGIDAKTLRATAKAILREHPDLSREQLLEMTRALWDIPNLNLRAVAVYLLDLASDRLGHLTDDRALVTDEPFIIDLVVDGMAISDNAIL